MVTYCERDVIINKKVYDVLCKEKVGFSRESINLEQAVSGILEKQRKKGFLLDIKFATLLVATLQDNLDRTVKEVHKEFGAIDSLVNNAGITKDNLLMRISEDDFDKVIEVNLKSVFNMTKAVQKTFLKQRKGSLIHMSSVVGVRGNAGQSNYSASKAGIIGFSKSIALELGSRNIRSNVIAPGFIETEMTKQLSQEIVEKWRNGIPLKRGGIPEDVANACVFLASDLSSYITGQVLNVDGGMLT